MNHKLSKLYKHNTDIISEQTKSKIKSLAKVAPSMFLLGALPTSSQAQVLSDAGLICNPNLGTNSCDLPTDLDVRNPDAILIASSTSFGTTVGTTGGGSLPVNIVQSFGISSAGIDMDCDGDDEFNLWNGGVVRRWSSTGGSEIANFVGLFGVDFTNLSSGAAFGFDVTYNSPGGAIYGGIAALDCASGFVSASDEFQGGSYVFSRLNSAYAGTLQGNDLTFDGGPVPVGSSSFIPVQFDQAGNTHFGWVEVQIESGRVASVANTAYALTPEAPASLACDSCDVATIPTASEWGLITLGLLLLSFGTTMIIRKEGSLATDQGNLSLDFNKPLFNADVFKKSLLVALGLGLMLSIGSVVLTGTLTLTDIIGGAIATPILAYWLHLIGMYKNDEI